MTTREIDVLLQAARPLVELAVAEDIGPGDATSNSTLGTHAILTGRIVAKEPGVVAGLPVAEALFERIQPEIDFRARVADGQEVVSGELLAEVIGPARDLLAGERTALNFLQRMSGIATLTRQFVDAVACAQTAILDTRKTQPGYRVLDKYAVRMGGGLNHRLSLYDMILIKDNHIDAAGGISLAVERARTAHPDLPIEVEVRNLDELGQVLDISPPIDRAMLDNMDLDTMRKAVVLTSKRVLLEASGGVTLERAAEIAATGVDYVSIGALTHSAPALDISMKIVPPGRVAAIPSAGTRIAAAKAALGERLVILGHHYQRQQILAHADLRGDSLKLARDAAQAKAEFAVFCGVHFMAETSAILAQPGQHIFIPDPSAGCYLADTADPDAIQAAWRTLSDTLGDAGTEFTPITYVNSSAELKAFCGRHGGIVCTSSNAPRAVEWALARRPRVFFYPDQHLGRNTALKLGISPDEMLVWDAHFPPSPDQIRAARVILWPGACNVHQRFRPEDVTAARQRYPGIRIIVHPESKAEVVALADDAGSTAHIISQVEAAPPGSQWAIGTETRLVQRLQRENPEQTIVSLAQVPPFCPTMSQITPEHLANTLENLVAGNLDGEVTVKANTSSPARLALERMLEL